MGSSDAVDTNSHR